MTIVVVTVKIANPAKITIDSNKIVDKDIVSRETPIKVTIYANKTLSNKVSLSKLYSKIVPKKTLIMMVAFVPSIFSIETDVVQMNAIISSNKLPSQGFNRLYCLNI